MSAKQTASSAGPDAGSCFNKVNDLAAFSQVGFETVRASLDSMGSPSMVVNVCKARVQRVRDELRRTFADRDQAIDLLLATTAAGIPMVLLGPPGTGKTILVERFAQLLGIARRPGDRSIAGGFFEYLLTKHTMPEEIFGPPSITALNKGEYLRVTDGMLPQAQIAFLDEVFRGGSTILNTLLAMINEGIFHNGREVQAVPLLTVVGAANDRPPEGELDAFYDRFPIRVWVDSIFAGPSRQDANARALDLLDRSAQLDRRGVVDQLACVNDFWVLRAACRRDLQAAIKADWVREFVGMFGRLRSRLHLSDRSLYRLLLVAVALKGHVAEPESWRHLLAYTAPGHKEFRAIREELAVARAAGDHSGDD